MVLSAVIEAVNYNTGLCSVNIPDLQSAADSGPVVREAVILETPGIRTKYSVGDKVWVAFIRDEKRYPIVIGHILTNQLDSVGGLAQVDSLDVFTSAILPHNTSIQNADDEYNSLLKIINKLKATASFIETYKGLDPKLKEILATLDVSQKAIIDIDSRLKAIEQNGLPDTSIPDPEPEPEPGYDGDITDYIKNYEVITYLPFNGDIIDKCGNTTTAHGELAFIKENYFGSSVSVDEGYVTLDEFNPGQNSFTVSFWLNANTIPSGNDPCIFSNQNWNSGANGGFTLTINSQNITLNIGNGSSSLKCSVNHPSMYTDSWMHVLAVVDRTANKIGVCVDFGTLKLIDLPEAFRGDLSTIHTANIGQDGTGKYKYPLRAAINEFMIFDGAFNQDDTNNLKAYYTNKTN